MKEPFSRQALTQGQASPKENRLAIMEIGLTGHLPLPTLPEEKPTPLHHLLERLRRSMDRSALAGLRATLDCLEFLERYFTGFAGGLARKLEDSTELATLMANSSSTPGLRRLFRYALNRLEHHLNHESVRDLGSCFFLHGKRSLPFSHARWVGLGSGGEPTLESSGWSYESFFEGLASRGDDPAIREALRQTLEVLQSWLESALSFFESHNHFARLDEFGWQCTVQKGDTFVELVPPLPARLIPVEAQAPSVAPSTEDESSLFLVEQTPRVGSQEEDVPAAPVATSKDGNGVAAVSTEEGLDPDSEEVAEHSARIALDVPESNPRWSASELKSFENSLRQIYPRMDLERVPRDYFQTLSRFLSSVSSGYIILEGRQGTGKTTICQAYRDYLVDSSLDATPLLFSVKNQFYPDTHTFLEQLNEHLRIRPGSGQRAFEALDPQVIKNLNLRTSAEARASRFSAFLSELRLVNGTRIVLLLDGLDEGAQGNGVSDSLFSYLPVALPEGVYIVLSYHPDRCRPADRDVLADIRQGASTEVVLSADAANYRDLVERFLNRGGEGPLSEGMHETLMEKSGGRLATAGHMLDAVRCQLFEGTDDLPTPDRTYERLFDRLYARVPDRYLDLFLLLATSDEPVSGDELSNLGISRTDVLELVHSLPSLFHCYQERGIGLNLAHRAIRLHLQRTFLTSYAQSCLRLAQRALRRISETEITILPVREDLDRLGEGVRRLLRWAYDSQDADFLAEVSAHPLLGKLRRRIFAAMEERALYHRKALILDTFTRGLERLVQIEGREEFREELAWSLSSRALSYYHLGHFQRALVDIEMAIGHFETMVEGQSIEALRNGFAAALNRRSEIYRGMGDWQKALTDAERAVRNYEQVVEGGRNDLLSLLMLAYHNRGAVHRALRQSDLAEADLSKALDGYLRLVNRDNRRDLRPQLAAVYQTRAALALDRGDSDLALSSASAALELFELLVHQESFEGLRNDLASVYNDRGATLYRAGIYDEAERDYASAISIRTYLVAEGRIDVRVDLAKTYANRGLCLIVLGEVTAARESFDRAVEILDRLIEEERREDLHADRAFALNCRGSLARQGGDMVASREDFSAAAGDYRLAVVSQGESHLEDLAHTLNSLAEVALAGGDTVTARRSCERALEIYDKKLLPTRRQSLARERAIAYHNLGETLRTEGDEAEAEKEFNKAIELLTHEVEQMGRPQLTGELATSILRLAELGSQTPDSRLRLLSRALAFFTAAESNDERWANLLDETLLLRATAYKELRSPGAALDDISRVVSRLEEARWGAPDLGPHLINALLERSALFTALEDAEAALLDLERAWTVVEEVAPAVGEAEAELRRCHILFERIRLTSSATESDFSRAISLLHELDTRLADVPIDQLATRDHRLLKKRAVHAFKELRYAALVPTREGDFESGAVRLTALLELARGLRPSFTELLKGDPTTDGEFDQVTRLRTQRAWVRVKQGNLHEALRDFEQTASELPPIEVDTPPDALEFIAEVESGRGAVLDSLERTEDALLAYQRAVEAFSRRPESMLSPRRAACLTNRAQLFARSKRYREALKDIDPAIEIARSNYQKTELMYRWAFKAQILRQSGDQLASLATYREALNFALRDASLEAELELPLRLGLFRLTQDSQEAELTLRRILDLLADRLAQKPRAWRAEATRLFSELPYPRDDADGLDLETRITRTIALLYKASPPGHTSITETLLRRAARLFEMKAEGRAFRTLASAQYCLAAKFCCLEFQKYGKPSLLRLLRTLILAGRSLVEGDSPSELEGLGQAFEEVAGAIFVEPPQGELEVEVNNLARLWLSLPPSKVLAAGISRATLQKLRRW